MCVRMIQEEGLSQRKKKIGKQLDTSPHPSPRTSQEMFVCGCEKGRRKGQKEECDPSEPISVTIVSIPFVIPYRAAQGTATGRKAGKKRLGRVTAPCPKEVTKKNRMREKGEEKKETN